MHRLLTKQSRENSRQYQFEQLIKDGYTREDYKDLQIFARFTDFYLKVFRGTSSNHILYIRFRNAEALSARISQLKASTDSREKYKAEQKEKNKGHKSSHAATAAAIKAELSAAFPGVKFSAKSDSYAGGDSVNVSWTDGPTEKAVKMLTGKYEMGSFNGMEDIYEYTNSREDIPQVKYVFERREISPELLAAVEAQMPNFYTFDNPNDYRHNPRQKAVECLAVSDIPVNYTGFAIAWGSVDDCRELVVNFETPAAPTNPEATQTTAPTEAAPGTVQIIEHPVRKNKILVVGETYPIKDKLKSAGGWWNKWEKGWEFKAEALPELVELLQGSKPCETQPEAVEVEAVEVLPDEPTAAQLPNAKPDETPQTYETLEAIEEAAQGGKVISILNLAQLVNQRTAHAY